jgi:hypothetical protein
MSIEEVSLEAIEQELMRRKQQIVTSLRDQIKGHAEAIKSLEESLRQLGQAKGPINVRGMRSP